MASLVQPFADGKALQQIAAPTLLVPGVDATHPIEAADVYRANLKNCVMRLADPASYADEITRFVG